MGDKKYFRWMDEEKKKGGAREGAGRKPVDEKAVGVSIYLRPSVIEVIGGKEAVQAVMKAAAFEAYSNKLSKAPKKKSK